MSTGEVPEKDTEVHFAQLQAAITEAPLIQEGFIALERQGNTCAVAPALALCLLCQGAAPREARPPVLIRCRLDLVGKRSYSRIIRCAGFMNTLHGLRIREKSSAAGRDALLAVRWRFLPERQALENLLPSQ